MLGFGLPEGCRSGVTHDGFLALGDGHREVVLRLRSGHWDPSSPVVSGTDGKGTRWRPLIAPVCTKQNIHPPMSGVTLQHPASLQNRHILSPVPRISHLSHLRQTYALPLFLGNGQFWSDMFSALVTETDREVLVTGCLDDHAG